jgi:hypothetical protein
MTLSGFAVDSGSEFVCEADALESVPTGGAGCGLKPTRRPLRGTFPYEFSEAWGNLPFR